MADNDIEIKFGADTSDLEAAAQRAAVSIAGISDTLDALDETAGKFGEVFGAAVKDGISKNADEAKTRVAALAAEFNAVQKGVQDTLAAYEKLNGQSGDRSARDAIKAQMEQYQFASKSADLEFRETQEHLAAELKLHQITYSQETAALLDAVAKRHAAEADSLEKEQALYAVGSAQYQKYENERLLLEKKYELERQKINDQSAEEEAKQWQKAADQVAGAFNSQLRGLLAGTTSWSQAMKKVSADLILKMIEDQVKLTVEFLANQARQLAGTVATQTGMTSATAAGAAIRSAAEVLSGQTSILSVISNALTAVYAGAGKTAAGVAGAVAPEAGPAAPAIGAAAGAAVVAISEGIGKFDIGTDFVLRSGLAIIHQGEQIIPAARGSGPYTGAGMGAQVHAPVSINVSALDSQSVARFFNDNSKHVLRAINDAVKRGAHLGLRGART